MGKDLLPCPSCLTRKVDNLCRFVDINHFNISFHDLARASTSAAMLAPQPRRPAVPTTISSPVLSSSKHLRPQPIQRRSTLKRSIDETSLMDTPSSPSKRSRVTFDSDVEIVSADDDEDLDPLVVKEQVRRALERHRVNDNEGYDRLQNLFSTTPEKPNASRPRKCGGADKRLQSSGEYNPIQRMDRERRVILCSFCQVPQQSGCCAARVPAQDHVGLGRLAWASKDKKNRRCKTSQTDYHSS